MGVSHQQTRPYVILKGKDVKTIGQKRKASKKAKYEARMGYKLGAFFVFIGFILAAVFIYSLLKYQPAQTYTITREIAIPTEEVSELIEEQTPVERKFYEINAKDLGLLREYQKVNDEVVGIITIPDTILRHPLMQSPARGESFYLYHDLDRVHNFHGIPFLTLPSDIYKESGNNIVYGHNIIWTEPKDVFCDLCNYEDINYYKEHPIIEIATNKGTVKYIIFSYALIDTSDPDSFVYWETYDFEDDAVFNSYMNQMMQRNWLITDVPCTRYDAYITISTCSKELAHSGTNRMVVMGRRLEVGEDYERYIENASINPDPLLPRKLRKGK